MFTTELKFAAYCLLKWFNAKFKFNNFELNNSTKRKYEIENPIDGSCNRCCICPFLLEINATKFDADNETMSYVDFIIFKEHTFLRNIFSSKEPLRPVVWKIWKPIFRLLSKCTQYLNYHSIIALQNALNMHEEFSDCFNEDFLNFFRNNCAHCSDFYKLKETIVSVKVKSNLGFKTSKFTLQIYVFVYKMLMDFPLGRFDFHALTT